MNARRSALTAFLVLGVTGALVAQSQSPTRGGQISRRSGEPITMTAGSYRMDGIVTEMTGGVKFVIDGTSIVASEATVNARTGEVILRGNVKILTR